MRFLLIHTGLTQLCKIIIAQYIQKIYVTIVIYIAFIVALWYGKGGDDMKTSSYSINTNTIKQPNNDNFFLHNHDFYEIFMFSKGDSEYIVEGNTYTLEPGDIIIIRRNEMHRVYHKSESEYARTVIEVYPSFFLENNCPEYEFPFSNTEKEGNKISAELARKVGLTDAIARLEAYDAEARGGDTPVCRSIVIEILYLISRINVFLGDDTHDDLVKQILLYINNNFAENINLDRLSERFFVSKYHICKIFKNGTGHTVHSYVTRKRITHVRELRKQGKSISEAAYLSGFGNYTSFYRAYLKEFGVPPGKMDK